MKTIVNSAFVNSATNEQLKAIAVLLAMTPKQIGKANGKGMLRQHVGTKLAQGATREAFDAGTLEMDIPEASVQEEPQASAEPPKGKRAATKSAKDWLRELLEDSAKEFTMVELVALTGKTEVNIRTMLSDLRSAKYAGKKGVFNTKSTRKDGKVYYSRA